MFGMQKFLLCSLSILVLGWSSTTELLHQVHPVIVIKDPSHWKTPQPQTQNHLHILHRDSHLAARKVEGVGPCPPPVDF